MWQAMAMAMAVALPPTTCWKPSSFWFDTMSLHSMAGTEYERGRAAESGPYFILYMILIRKLGFLSHLVLADLSVMTVFSAVIFPDSERTVFMSIAEQETSS